MPPRRQKLSVEAPLSDEEVEEVSEEAPPPVNTKPLSRYQKKYRADPSFAESVRERARENHHKKKEERDRLKAIVEPKLGAGHQDVSAMLYLMAKIDESERKRRKLKKEIRGVFGSIVSAADEEKPEDPRTVPTESLRAPIRVQADEARPASPYSPRSDSEVTAPTLRIMRRADKHRR